MAMRKLGVNLNEELLQFVTLVAKDKCLSSSAVVRRWVEEKRRSAKRSGIKYNDNAALL